MLFKLFLLLVALVIGGCLLSFAMAMISIIWNTTDEQKKRMVDDA